MSERLRLSDVDRMEDESQTPEPEPREETKEPEPREQLARPRQQSAPPAEADQAPQEPSEQQAQPELDKAAEAKPGGEDGAIDKRFRQLTFEKWEARRQAEELQQRLAALERQQQQPQGQQNPVEQAKQELLRDFQQQQFNQQCNDTYAKGKAEFPDFDEAVQALNAVGAGSRQDFLTALTSLPEAHRVYRTLAQDLDNVARLLRLPPMAMAVELARMAVAPQPSAAAPNGAQNLPPLAPVTRAPPPLRPIGGSSRAPPRLEQMTMAEFIKQRDKEEAERRR